MVDLFIQFFLKLYLTLIKLVRQHLDFLIDLLVLPLERHLHEALHSLHNTQELILLHVRVPIYVTDDARDVELFFLQGEETGDDGV